MNDLYDMNDVMDELSKSAHFRPEGKDVYVDIIESEDRIYVTIPLPRAIKEEIGLWAKELSLDIRAGDITKHIVLPHAVDPESVKASFKNGMLSIEMKKRD